MLNLAYEKKLREINKKIFLELREQFLTSEKRVQLSGRLFRQDCFDGLFEKIGSFNNVDVDDFYKHLNRSVNVEAIIDEVNQFTSEGFTVVGYISSFSPIISNALRGLNELVDVEYTALGQPMLTLVDRTVIQIKGENFIEVGDCRGIDIQNLSEMIKRDIQSNYQGRILGIRFTWKDHVNGVRFFAFHPNDKDNPDLKNIWVDVYIDKTH